MEKFVTGAHAERAANARSRNVVSTANAVDVPSVKLWQSSVYELRTWIAGAIFVAAGIVLPQLAHLIPQGGLILLPIYFFTLVAGYKFGSVVGLISALGAPLAGFLAFGMPAFDALGVIVFKGAVLALAAGFAARRARRVSLGVIACVTASYLLVGGVFEWAMTGSLAAALQDLTLGVPGVALQIFGGWALLRALAKL